MIYMDPDQPKSFSGPLKKIRVRVPTFFITQVPLPDIYWYIAKS